MEEIPIFAGKMSYGGKGEENSKPEALNWRNSHVLRAMFLRAVRYEALTAFLLNTGKLLPVPPYSLHE